MNDLVPKLISDYLFDLSNQFTGVNEIWFVGSRANNRFSSDSDWDFIVFADKDTLMQMRKRPDLKKDKIDLLIVFDGDQFESPWHRDDKPKKYKKGNLFNYENSDGIEVVTWEWDIISSNEANYTGENFREEKAFCIFRRNNK